MKMPHPRRGPPTGEDALALELIDKLCDRSKLLVQEEFALLAMRVNTHFHCCDHISDVEHLAERVYAHNPAIISALLDAIIQGDTCVHISLELLASLAHSPAAAAELVQRGVMTTLIGVFPVLPAVAQLHALQLLDHLTLDRARITQLCRVACVRALLDVLTVSDAVSSESLTLALTLLDKITDRIVTATAGDAGSWPSAARQIVLHTTQRESQLLHILHSASAKGSSAIAVAHGDEEDPHGDDHETKSSAHHSDDAVTTATRIYSRVQRWRVSLG